MLKRSKDTKTGGDFEFCPTPRWPVRRLLEDCYLPPGRWLEPGAGGGAIITAVEEVMPGQNDWTAVEIRKEARPILETAIPISPTRRIIIGDFLQVAREMVKTKPERGRFHFDVAIGNPPFSFAEEFVELARLLAAFVVLLLPTSYLGSAARQPKHRIDMPERSLWLPDRPSFSPDGETDSRDYSWLVWTPTKTPVCMTRILGLTSLDERKRDAGALFGFMLPELQPGLFDAPRLDRAGASPEEFPRLDRAPAPPLLPPAPKPEPTLIRFPHRYPGIVDGEFVHTSDCAYGCGAWMGGSRSGAPNGINPDGECPALMAEMGDADQPPQAPEPAPEPAPAADAPSAEPEAQDEPAAAEPEASTPPALTAEQQGAIDALLALGPSTARQVAKQIGVKPKATGELLETLVPLGLAVFTDDAWRLTDDGRARAKGTPEDAAAEHALVVGFLNAQLAKEHDHNISVAMRRHFNVIGAWSPGGVTPPIAKTAAVYLKGEADLDSCHEPLKTRLHSAAKGLRSGAHRKNMKRPASTPPAPPPPPDSDADGEAEPIDPSWPVDAARGAARKLLTHHAEWGKRNGKGPRLADLFAMVNTSFETETAFRNLLEPTFGAEAVQAEIDRLRPAAPPALELLEGGGEPAPEEPTPPSAPSPVVRAPGPLFNGTGNAPSGDGKAADGPAPARDEASPTASASDDGKASDGQAGLPPAEPAPQDPAASPAGSVCPNLARLLGAEDDPAEFETIGGTEVYTSSNGVLLTMGHSPVLPRRGLFAPVVVVKVAGKNGQKDRYELAGHDAAGEIVEEADAEIPVESIELMRARFVLRRAAIYQALPTLPAEEAALAVALFFPEGVWFPPDGSPINKAMQRPGVMIPDGWLRHGSGWRRFELPADLEELVRHAANAPTHADLRAAVGDLRARAGLAAKPQEAPPARPQPPFIGLGPERACAPGAWGSPTSCLTHEGFELDANGKCIVGRGPSPLERAVSEAFREETPPGFSRIDAGGAIIFQGPTLELAPAPTPTVEIFVLPDFCPYCRKAAVRAYPGHVGWADCTDCGTSWPLKGKDDPLHPTGRCSCGGEGECAWCEAARKAETDPATAPEAEPEMGIMEQRRAEGRVKVAAQISDHTWARADALADLELGVDGAAERVIGEERALRWARSSYRLLGGV